MTFCGQEFSGALGLCVCIGMSETEAEMVTMAFCGEIFGREVAK